jgi:hypothetical protein
MQNGKLRNAFGDAQIPNGEKEHSQGEYVEQEIQG